VVWSVIIKVKLFLRFFYSFYVILHICNSLMSTMVIKLRCTQTFSTTRHNNVLGSNILFDHVLLVSHSLVSVYSFNAKYFLQINYTESTSWFKSFLSQKCDLTSKLFYIVDGSQFLFNNIFTVQFNCNSMATDFRVHLYTSVCRSSLRLDTVSVIYESTTWLEREISDFTNIFFENSMDTRRLLLDYFQPKEEINTHINNEKSYSNLYYEVILNY
jgi:NADH:ubiquinone oxidoreductase subunit C